MSEWPRFPVEHRRRWGHFKTSAQQCYQAAEFLLLSVSHHYSSGADCRRGPLRQTVFCCILMCANQLNAGPSIHPRYCFSTADAHVLPSAGAPRHVWESREVPREVTSKEKGTESVGGLSTLQLSSVVCSKACPHRGLSSLHLHGCTCSQVRGWDIYLPKSWCASAVKVHQRVCWSLGACRSCGDLA